MRFIRIGRFIINVDLAKKITGLEPSFWVTGEDAELLRRHLRQMTGAWKPLVPGQHPRGPLGIYRPGPDEPTPTTDQEHSHDEAQDEGDDEGPHPQGPPAPG